MRKHISLLNDKDVKYRLELAAEWIYRSFLATARTGSAAYYSPIIKPLSGWAPAYPETTGYIVPTLIEYGKWIGEKKYIDIALEMASWLLTLQNDRGAFPGGVINRKNVYTSSVFNTGQIIQGLVAAYNESRDDIFLNSAIKAAKWLSEEQSVSGEWLTGAYVQGFSPSYYTRVCWPMLQVYQLTNEKWIKDRAEKGLSIAVGRVGNKGWMDGLGFRPNSSAFSHTIAYTIEGLLESASILGINGEGKVFWECGKYFTYKIFKLREVSGYFAGAYDEMWKPDHSFVCLTGNCQMAICMVTVFNQTRDYRLLNTVIKLLKPVLSHQSLYGPSKGGMPGSSPFWGKYMRLRYPNWAVKFFMDAVMRVYIFLKTEDFNETGSDLRL